MIMYFEIKRYQCYLTYIQSGTDNYTASIKPQTQLGVSKQENRIMLRTEINKVRSR